MQHHQKPVTIRAGTSFILTPLGKQKADSFGGSGLKYDVLCFIAGEHSATIEEIAGEIGGDLAKAKAIMRVLIQNNYARMTSEGGME